MLIGYHSGSGFGNWFAKLLQPLRGNIIGLVILGFICSISFLSCLLGPGAVIAQIVGTLIGEIGKGNIEPSLHFQHYLQSIHSVLVTSFQRTWTCRSDPETEVGVPAVLSLKIYHWCTSSYRWLLSKLWIIWQNKNNY